MRQLTDWRDRNAAWLTKRWVLMWLPALVAGLLLISMLLESSRSHDPGLFALAAIAAALGLAISRRFPLLAHGSAAMAMLLNALASGWLPILWLTAITALLLAAWSAPTWPRRLVAGASALGAISVAGLISDVMNAMYWGYAPGEFYVDQGFWQPVQIGVLWGIVLGIRAFIDTRAAKRQLAMTEGRIVTTQSALRDEQLRSDLTRDFHDVMAHSLAVLAAQAEGLRLTHEQHPERIGPVLETISETARLSLIEVRQLLERSEEADRFGLDDLPALVDQVRSAGLTVTLHTIGEPQPLGCAGELAVYRVTQEALTNALRHGAPGDVRAVLSWVGPGLTLTVTSATSADSRGFEPGRGIRGMRERAEAAGGGFEVSAAEGSFVVTAFLPANPELAAAEALGGGAPSRDVMHPHEPVPNPLGRPLREPKP